jgi:hypothetical protein
MVNLTPHPITVIGADGAEHTFPPSGQLARVATIEAVTGVCAITGAPVVTRTLGDVQGLPDDGAPCIVSAMVLAACPGRAGVYAPDTGSTAIRDERGQVKAVTRLVAA